ncbi:hypothetical protein HY496_02165 [Candidatus Woesearchaeota archaeon]|nr:hypothetical protein [Candidatus Woesearchaeota archaeon]
MSKKCIICNAEAVYMIKDTSDYYCEECAEEHFGDIALLVKVEDDAQKLKEYLKSRLAPQEAEAVQGNDEIN